MVNTTTNTAPLELPEDEGDENPDDNRFIALTGEVIDLGPKLSTQERMVLAIDEAQLSDELRDYPSKLAWWATKLARAQGELLRSKLGTAKLRASYFKTIESKSAASGSKITVAQMDAKLDSIPELIAAAEEDIQAEVQRDHLKGVLAGLTAKRDCLIQIASTARAEMQREPSVSDHRRR